MAAAVRADRHARRGVYAGSWCVASAVAAPGRLDGRARTFSRTRIGRRRESCRPPLLRAAPPPTRRSKHEGFVKGRPPKGQPPQPQVRPGGEAQRKQRRRQSATRCNVPCQAWWRASVRAVVNTGELLTDERDELKRWADVMLVLQPPIDPNERKLHWVRREGRDGGFKLCDCDLTLVRRCATTTRR